MKTVKQIIAVLALVIVSGRLMAGNGPATTNAAMLSAIKNHISYTPAKSGEVKKVTFTFTVNESGKVNAVSANIETKQERKALEEQFAKLTFDGLTQGVTYSIAVNFINY